MISDGCEQLCGAVAGADSTGLTTVEQRSSSGETHRQCQTATQSADVSSLVTEFSKE